MISLNSEFVLSRMLYYNSLDPYELVFATPGVAFRPIRVAEFILSGDYFELNLRGSYVLKFKGEGLSVNIVPLSLILIASISSLINFKLVIY